MPETLQTDQGRYREACTSVRSVEIIVDHDFAEQIIQYVRMAQVEIRLCAYAWRWYDSEPELTIQRFNNELRRAARRGVIVRALVDSEAMSQKFSSLGFNVRSVVNTRTLHTKAICFDMKLLTIGSHNLTKHANDDNYEMSVAITEFEAIAQFCTYFDALWRSRA